MSDQAVQIEKPTSSRGPNAGVDANAGGSNKGGEADAARWDTMLDILKKDTNRVLTKAIHQDLYNMDTRFMSNMNDIESLFTQAVKPRFTSLNADLKEIYDIRDDKLLSKEDRVLKFRNTTAEAYAKVNEIESLLANMGERTEKTMVEATKRPLLFEEPDATKDTKMNSPDTAGAVDVSEAGRGLKPRTASGCICESSCARSQGMPFFWCKVQRGGSRCGVSKNFKDPRGWDHRLYAGAQDVVYPEGRGPPVTSDFWDYCSAPILGAEKDTSLGDPKAPAPSAIKTTHPGCYCVRNSKIGESQDFTITNQIDAWKAYFMKQYPEVTGSWMDYAEAFASIPLRDRFAALIVWMYDGSETPETQVDFPAKLELQVCRKVPGSGEYSVCPVDIGCVDSQFNDGTIFSGANRSSWDFCTHEGWGGEKFTNSLLGIAEMKKG